ncbi:MAG TPA: ATP-binding protein [Allosphingosinicella sp.]|jgi:molecular chaperone HtpG
MTDANVNAPEKPKEPKFLIGSYVLETLTTGMYIEPRDCIREYVQNGFDAIRSARETLAGRSKSPRIDITVGDADGGYIRIKDTGSSIPSDRVWETLTSIGASRKNARRQAGFRGIGRLAGIAYCDLLEFTTKAAGDEAETIVSYDCRKLREAVREGDEELEPVFRRSISTRVGAAAPADDHYTVVTLQGLAEAPDELKSVSDLMEYLRMVAPISFRQGWNHADEIRRHAEEIDQPIPTIPVYIGPDGEPGEELRKPYTSTIHAGSKPATIRKIHFLNGGEAAGARWWGWHAETPLYGIISDQFAGIRLRARNIQLGGADILNRTLYKHARSYSRFGVWLIGEIYIEGDTVFPNARRDGLEDSPAWREIEGQIAAELVPLAKAAYAASKNRKSRDFTTVKEITDREISEVEASLQPQQPGTAAPEPPPDKKATERKLRAAMKRIDGLNLDEYTDEQQTELREAGIRLRALAQQASVTLKPSITSRRSTPGDGEVPHRDILDVVLEVLQSILDTRTFNKARQLLLKRFKDL